MFEFINDHFKYVFSCDTHFDQNDYKIGEDEEYRNSFFWKKWFKMKNNCPRLTEEKGKAYLEKNKINILNNHNINYCIYLARLYNNSVDLLNTISNNMTINYQREKEDIEFIMDINKAEKESIYDYNSKKNNKDNLINDEKIDNSFNIIFENSLISNENIINNKKKKGPKNYKENKEFVIELDIEIEHPKISVITHVIGNYYVFKIKINEEEITLEKSISEIQLENEKIKNIRKEGNIYYLIFDLRKEDDAKEFQF